MCKNHSRYWGHNSQQTRQKRLFKELSFENREKANRHININTIETSQKSENSSLRKKVLFWQRPKNSGGRELFTGLEGE